MMHKRITLMAALLSIMTGCVPIAERDFSLKGGEPEDVVPSQDVSVDYTINLDSFRPSPNAHSLASWWTFFDDPVLSRLVDSSTRLNPVSRGSMSGDVSGQMREEALRSYYRNPELRLVVEVVQSYLRYRYIQNQDMIVLDYLDKRDFSGEGAYVEKELSMLQKQHKRYTAQKKDTIAKIARITKLLPEYVTQILRDDAPLPTADITPILANQASLMMGADEVMVARAIFAQGLPSLSHQATKDIFGSEMFATFFGVSDDVFTGRDTLWQVSTGLAVERVNLDALDASYEDNIAYTDFRRRVLSYLLDIEHALVSYAYMHEQHVALKVTQESAENEKEFFEARKATLRAEYEKSKMLVDLYKALGVY